MHTKGSTGVCLLQRARRMAQRSRAAAACLPCKAGKARCNDYRPCARCKKAGINGLCVDPQSKQPGASLNVGKLSSISSMSNPVFDGPTPSFTPSVNARQSDQSPWGFNYVSPFHGARQPEAQRNRIDAMNSNQAQPTYLIPSLIGGASSRLELVQV
jgi:hypothetical protein